MGLVKSKIDTDEVKKPIRDYLTSCGWTRAGFYGLGNPLKTLTTSTTPGNESTDQISYILLILTLFGGCCIGIVCVIFAIMLFI